MSRYIDADKLSEELDKFKNDVPLVAMAFARGQINAAPTADVVEVVHAQWIKRIDPLEWCEDDVDVYYECSNCGCNNYGESPYCPDCGAKMDVVYIDGDYEFCEV